MFGPNPETFEKVFGPEPDFPTKNICRNALLPLKNWKLLANWKLSSLKVHAKFAISEFGWVLKTGFLPINESGKKNIIAALYHLPYYATLQAKFFLKKKGLSLIFSTRRNFQRKLTETSKRLTSKRLMA